VILVIEITDFANTFAAMYIEWREKIKNRFSRYPKLWAVLLKGKSVAYAYNYLKYYKKPFSPTEGSIREVNIEFCSDCNLRCKFCSLDHLKPKQHISPEVLETVLEELVYHPKFSKVEVLNLYNGGETLLHPKRLELFEIIAKYKNKAAAEKRHFPKVLLLTNGMLMRERLARSILELQVLDVVQFSLDGGNIEKFEELRVNAKWPLFYKNVKALMELKKELQPNLQLKSITILEDQFEMSTDWMEPEFKELVLGMDSYELRRLHDWGGEVELEESKKTESKIYGCGLAMHQMVVLPNGDVTMCCNDLNSNGVVGNVLKTTLAEVYESPERRNYIDKLLVGKRDELELCKNCRIV